MGTHISRVKSVDLDSWTDEQIQSVIRWGNARANKYVSSGQCSGVELYADRYSQILGSQTGAWSRPLGSVSPPCRHNSITNTNGNVDSKIENFIRTKYESKRWVMDGPMPDPATLDVGDDNVVSSIGAFVGSAVELTFSQASCSRPGKGKDRAFVLSTSSKC
jgi:stromal membrane-associated protein